MNRLYTFDSFTVGKSSRLAYAMAKAIVRNPGRRHNPCLIYGPVGLGKTHLLHSIGNAISSLRQHARILDVTANQFAEECARAVRAKKLGAFRARYRRLDCLLIDDIQFLIAKGRSQQELLYILNELISLHKQVVITSWATPQDLAPLAQTLISRLVSGSIVEITPPDLETRIAILRKKMEIEEFSVPKDVSRYVASSVKTNVRCLEGALIRLKAFQSMTGRRISVDDAREILKDTLG